MLIHACMRLCIFIVPAHEENIHALNGVENQWKYTNAHIVDGY